MASRRRSFTVRCADPTCTKTTFYEYATNAEYASAHKRSEGWRCTRHENPEQVLGPANLERTAVLVATTLYTEPDRWDSEARPLGRYWIPEGGTTGSGFAYGPGYKAHADDVPEGTRLVVTARLELPTTEGEPA